MLFLCSRITSTNDQTKKSRSSIAKQQFCQNLSGMSECIFPECYNSISELNSSSICTRENTFVDLHQSKSLYDGISTQIPVNAIHTNNDIFLKQTDFTYLSIK